MLKRYACAYVLLHHFGGHIAFVVGIDELKQIYEIKIVVTG